MARVRFREAAASQRSVPTRRVSLTRRLALALFVIALFAVHRELSVLYPAQHAAATNYLATTPPTTLATPPPSVASTQAASSAATDNRGHQLLRPTERAAVAAERPTQPGANAEQPAPAERPVRAAAAANHCPALTRELVHAAAAGNALGLVFATFVNAAQADFGRNWLQARTCRVRRSPR